VKIAFFEIKDWEKDYLKDRLKDHKLSFFDTEIRSSHVSKIKECECISVFIYSKVSKEVIEKLPKLKLVCTRSTGFDHIDMETCKERNISVCNVPFYGENTVAEHTFALILSLSRNVHKSYVRTLRDDYSIDGLTGFDLKGRTIGVVGGGHIGMHVARIAKGFGTEVLVYDIKRDSFMSEIIGFEYADLDDLLRRSDIVTLHVPYNKYTHHIINRKNIKLMKKGATLINTARGQLIDTDALLDALKSGHIGGAGLDVLEGEELIREERELLHDNDKSDAWRTIIRNQRIFKMDNVVFTPHNAFNSKEALIRILDTTSENVTAFLKGKPINMVSN
jgi:D-lactate dehydrogenase